MSREKRPSHTLLVIELKEAQQPSTSSVLNALRHVAHDIVDVESSILDEAHWVCEHNCGPNYEDIEVTPVSQDSLARHHYRLDEI